MAINIQSSLPTTISSSLLSVVKITPTDPTIIKPALRMHNDSGGAVEVLTRRVSNAKTFQASSPNQFMTIVGSGDVHYKDSAGNWKEIDLTISKDQFGNLTSVNTPYQCKFFTDRVGYSIVMVDGSSASIELSQVGGVAVDNSSLQITQDAIQVFYTGLSSSLAFKIVLTASRPEIFTLVGDSTVAKTFTWLVKNQGNVSFTTAGKDADKNSLEMVASTNQISSTSFTYTETFTGRVSRISDPKTRVKQWFTDPTYPLSIDPSITVNITTNADNGFQGTFNGNFHTSYVQGGHGSVSNRNQWLPSFRFRNVGIPTGATITSATLKLTANGAQEASGPNKWFGNKIGNAATWQSEKPTAMTKTTTSTSFQLTGAFGAVNSIPMTSPVASIVGLGSWASNNAMKFAGFSWPGSYTYNPIGFYQAGSGGTPAQLIITYTTGGGGTLTIDSRNPAQGFWANGIVVIGP